ncbi:MAG TPA: FeoA family protein [Longimicrobiaceae bacterium]|nr:FeoA family protein [Longimicrobiaceae bacterium]
MKVAGTLAELQPGERGKVTRVEAEGDAARRLMDMGLIRGTTVEVVRRAPLGDPMEVKLRGFMLTLRRSEAEQVMVE